MNFRGYVNLIAYFSLLTLWVCVCVSAQAADLASLNRKIEAADLNGAVADARLLVQNNQEADITLPIARLARALEKAERTDEAAQFYELAYDAASKSSAHALPPATIQLVKLAAAKAMSNSEKADKKKAIRILGDLLASDAFEESQQANAASIALRLGATTLAAGDNQAAQTAYQMALKSGDQNQRAPAMLGAAWALLVGREQPLETAKQLAAFVQAYPQHQDAASATRACAQCLRESGREDDANVVLADLLDRWPESTAAFEVVRGHSGLSLDKIPVAVRTWISKESLSEEIKKWDPQLTSLGLLVTASAERHAAWSNLVGHLGRIDESGAATSNTLASLTENGKHAEAEQLASRLISPCDDTTGVSTAAQEAACRWAGRNERWSMLALAAESETEHMNDSARRTVGTEHLFAEALVQLGHVDRARPWWNFLVDERKSQDFATLLRCAEAETSIGTDSELAHSRIAAARKAAGENHFHATLVDMLSAELAIRRSKFDEARALLENVVRASETDPGLRGRAQWLIGETQYLQQHYAEAIEAYRRVEAMEPGEIWVSAALLQAGKSFEQLGRTRQATVCYGNLISRFPNSAHTSLARQRLAAIDPTDPTSNHSIRR